LTLATTPPAKVAREQARQILAQRRFHGTPVPQPFHGPLSWLGRELSRAFDAFRISIPGTHQTLNLAWLAFGLVVVGIAVLVTLRISRRRGGLHVDRRGGAAVRAVVEDDPAALDRRADAAEQAGDLSGALRLRFRAGLVRLARARAIPARDSVTTGEVRRALRSAEFDELARSFDEVAYGRREARPDDLARARSSWPRVLQAARGS
jgi:Domain of unknown function (DUF4129)